ncbi:hypothetical protein A4A49_13928 [Nicotiana attenuata]|uniref:Gag-pol polyprotein n=1 Tax=Nicotiana attenuata TaxID=49451 RepID=A0A1J6INX3_NICAT|nr:hypothetical protein A4A49_13928 [Nicotiana attenuata]
MMDGKCVEAKLRNLFQEAQAEAEAKVAASEARTDAKFQQLSQQIEALIRTTTWLVDLSRLDVEMHNPSNLVQAMSLARAFEKKIQISSTTQRGYGSTSTGSVKVAGTAVTPSAKTSASSYPFVKRLTRTEMAARRAKGLCYNYDDPYVAGHQCKKLFWLEIEYGESKDITTDNEEPAISLHAITGKQHANTIQLQVVVDMKLLLSLVDSGSTHNFISSTATQRLGLPIHHQENLNVSEANGEKISKLGIFKGV